MGLGARGVIAFHQESLIEKTVFGKPIQWPDSKQLLSQYCVQLLPGYNNDFWALCASEVESEEMNLFQFTFANGQFVKQKSFQIPRPADVTQHAYFQQFAT